MIDASDFSNPLVWVPLLSAIAHLGLAAWFLGLDFEARLHRAFALFLALRGLSELGTGLLEVPGLNPYWRAVTPYFGIALPFALAHFAYTYRVTRLGKPTRPFLMPILVGIALLFEAVYFFDHTTFVARDDQDNVVFGPLFLLVGVLYLGYVLVAGTMSRDYVHRSHDPSSLYCAIGFSFVVVNAGLYYVFVLLLSPLGLPGSEEASTGSGPPVAAILVALLLAIASLSLVPTLVRLLRFASREPDHRWRTRRTTAYLLLPASTALIVVLSRYGSTDLSERLVVLFDALWSLGFALLVTYALVRHQLFDLDATIKVTLQRSTVGAVFVATFFITGELAQNLLTDRFDWVIGTVATALLLFALHPLQRLAHRIGDAAMPHTKTVAGMSHEERIALYQDQLRIAWADGTLSRKERLMLDTSRHRLGLDLEEAARLEQNVVRTR